MSVSIVLLLSSVYQTEKPLLSRTSDEYLKQWQCFVVVESLKDEKHKFPKISAHNSNNNASINSKSKHPPGQPPVFCTYFWPGSRGFVPSELAGVGPINTVPGC